MNMSSSRFTSLHGMALPLTLAMLAVAVLPAAGCRKNASPELQAQELPPPPPANRISLGEGAWAGVRRETLQSVYPAVGMFRARQLAKVGPQVSGRIEEVLVDAGDPVRREQPLVRLDPTLFEIDVAQREADVQAARVDLAGAELNFHRMKNLWEKPPGQEPSIPKKAFDDSLTRRDAAAAMLEQAKEALHRAQEKLDECTIRAPFDGVVTRRLVDTGESVSAVPVTHLLEVAQVDTLELLFSLPQRMLSRIGPGTRIRFQVDGIERGDGTGVISTVLPALDEATRTFRCRVIVQNPESRYRPGLLVRVEVTDRTAENALTVPRKALHPAGTGWQVIASSGGDPVLRDVRIGLQGENEVQVLEGLADGDRIWIPEESNS